LLHSNGNWQITAVTGFHLFLYLKRILAGKNFDSDDELMESVEKWLTSQAVDFYEQGIQIVMPRNDKCLNVGGDYVED
jgi:hypothetical protein